jgi:diguanylate cyclase (GGDEF)-like protein
MSDQSKSLSRWATAVSDWQVWSLPKPLRAIVISIPVLAGFITVVTAAETDFRARDLVLSCVLICCGIIAIEVTGSAVREPQGTIIRDLLTVWYLAIAITLPPAYAMIAPLPLGAFRLWRVQRTHVYRRVYSNATLSLAYGCAAALFRSLPVSVAGPRPGTGTHLLTWVLAVAACGVLAWVINNFLLVIALRLSDQSASLRSLMVNREAAAADLVELSLGTSVALLVALNPVLVALVLPSMAMYRRYLLHAQLVSQSRTDGKTGLLNAATWDREAGAEVARAIRTRTPLAVVLIDLDKFKLVNDTYGHVAGDAVLKTVARSLGTVLRDYDQAGRFGGEEFAVLLPQTRAVDAFRVAERIRAVIAGLKVEDPSTSDGTRISITVSVGVAALDGGPRRELTDLVAMADAALYRAKSAGRNQVQMISTTRGLSAVRPADQLEVVTSEAGTSSTATISEFPVWHSDVSPVLRTLGVAYPWQVQPPTFSGAPPPLPLSWPRSMAVAYAFSTARAVEQDTSPLATLMTTGMLAPLRVVPHVPAGADVPEDEQPVARPAAVQASAAQAVARPTDESLSTRTSRIQVPPYASGAPLRP